MHRVASEKDTVVVAEVFADSLTDLWVLVSIPTALTVTDIDYALDRRSTSRSIHSWERLVSEYTNEGTEDSCIRQCVRSNYLLSCLEDCFWVDLCSVGSAARIWRNFCELNVQSGKFILSRNVHQTSITSTVDGASHTDVGYIFSQFS